MKFIFLFTLIPFLSISQEVIPLWPNGAPGFESRKNEPELAKDWWVKNIHNPSITVFKAPKDKANGTAVIVCPGGGHRELVYTAEGVEAATYLNSIGVTAMVLKYRLAKEENSMYTLANTKEDVSRAMRLVRSKALDWGISRLGIMGFSAGGEVVTMIAYTGSTQPEALDPIDKLDSRPDFQILIYPGPGGIPEVIPNTAPPAFLLVANDDPCCSQPVMDLLSKYRKANLSIEAHIYAQGKHAFNMGNRSKLRSLHSWPDRLTDWLMDNGWIK